MRLGVRNAMLALLLFTALTAALYYKVLAGLDTLVKGSLDDAYAIIWQLWWFKYSIIDLGANPFFTPFVEAPLGVNVTYTTITNYILSFPFTWALGPVASYNIMIILSFILSSLGMYLLASHLTKDAVPSVFSALAYSFAPYHTVFSATGGMDAAQIQYLPFMLLFLLKYEGSRSVKDLGVFLFFFAAAVFSFGYYAVIASIVLIFYIAYFRAAPFIGRLYFSQAHQAAGDGKTQPAMRSRVVLPNREITKSSDLRDLAESHWAKSWRKKPWMDFFRILLEPGGGVAFEPRARGLYRAVLSASVIYSLFTLAVNSLDQASFYALAVFMTLLLALLALSLMEPAGPLRLLLRQLALVLGRIDRRHRSFGVIAGVMAFLAGAVFLLPVFAPASRNISGSYIVPYLSYIVWPPSHPLLGWMLPQWLIPDPDPLAGRIVHVGLAFLFLSASALVFLSKNAPGERGLVFMAVLFIASVFMTIPPEVEIGALRLRGPLYYIHTAIPPFVDVRRAVVLVLLSGSVLAGFALKEFAARTQRPAIKGLIYTLPFLLIALEYYPNVTISDTGKVSDAYLALSTMEDGITAEYPLTSNYDAGRYEAFYGQTVHGKRLLNPFGATGHDARPQNESLRPLVDRGGPLKELITNPENASSVLSHIGVRYLALRKDKLGDVLRADRYYLSSISSSKNLALYKVTARKAPAYISFQDFYRDGYFLNYIEKGKEGFVPRNPLILHEELMRGGLPWLWMGNSASLKITSTDNRERVFRLSFNAVSASNVRLRISSGEKTLGKFTIGKAESAHTVEGLHVRPTHDPLTIRLEVSGDSAPVYFRPHSTDGAPDRTDMSYLGIGIRNAILTPDGDSQKIDDTRGGKTTTALNVRLLEGAFVKKRGADTAL